MINLSVFKHGASYPPRRLLQPIVYSAVKGWKYVRGPSGIEHVFIALATEMLPFMGMTGRRIGPAPSPTVTAVIISMTPTLMVWKEGGEIHTEWGREVLEQRQHPNRDHADWLEPMWSCCRVMLRRTGLTPATIDIMVRKRARAAERRTRWYYAKVIQRAWREARLNPYCRVGYNKINRDYDALFTAK